MDLKPNAFGRRSLLCGGVALMLAAIGFCVFGIFAIILVPLLTAAVFAVGALHGLIGLWWDEARACSVAGLVLNLAGVAATLWVHFSLPRCWG